MKKILFVEKIICFVFKRHRFDRLKNSGAKFHQFYDCNGGGKMCICPHCKKGVLLANGEAK